MVLVVGDGGLYVVGYVARSIITLRISVLACVYLLRIHGLFGCLPL